MNTVKKTPAKQAQKPKLQLVMNDHNRREHEERIARLMAQPMEGHNDHNVMEHEAKIRREAGR